MKVIKNSNSNCLCGVLLECGLGWKCFDCDKYFPPVFKKPKNAVKFPTGKGFLVPVADHFSQKSN